MNRQQLRAIAQLTLAEAYLNRKAARQDVVALNPNVTARMGDRDANTGKRILTTASGSLSAKLITTSGGIAKGGVLPSVTLGKGANYGDAKP
ncbi:hypothetical protein AVDCRST_MAG94-7064 [uncultured Leptolyngbya sp.]|uniref:Uncharacterized protein n=1 Tax=uncultured Leptolyngbya sp. TaxID=332963 RepID=A0A6J4PUE9_9CYAN|nr:hypothetical protein AVDCRST_MAG94-7064 [uncultured Leptolyngbya sp.]